MISWVMLAAEQNMLYVIVYSRLFSKNKKPFRDIKGNH